MRKRIIHKILISIFVMTLIVGFLPFIHLNHKTDSFDDFSEKLPLFSNDSFITDLVEPSKPTKDEVISFTEIYNIVESYLSQETSGETEAIKQTRDQNIVAAILAAVDGYKVSIETAEELYNFSNTQSFNYRYASSINRYAYKNTIMTILSLDYILLNDIDYSSMRARKFVPIGTNILINVGSETIEHIYPFTGSFDGNSNTISNLYLADYSYITTTIQFDDDETTNTDISLIKHYAMFSLVDTGAVIKNFVLRNPIYELLDATNELTKTSMIAGENRGTIFNVGVIDEKTTQQGADNSGIRFGIQYSTSETYTAAGFVHTNSGTIKNSYLITKNVITPGLSFRFNTKPFIYTNTGTIENVAYSKQLETVTNDNTPVNGVLAYTLPELRSGLKATLPGEPGYPNPVKVNFDNDNIVNEPKWYFYEQDGYPTLVGLEYDSINNVFNIYHEYDFVNFMKMINYNSVYHGKTFDQHDYVLVEDINMKNIKNIKTPSKTFAGSLSGGTIDFTLSSSVNTNKYIFNLTLKRPYVFGSDYYLGLFSNLSGTVKNVNLFNNQVLIEDSKDHYGKTFYVGAVAARSTGAIKNVISKTDINLGTQPIGLTYVGGIAGIASNTISYVVNKGHINGGVHDFEGSAHGSNYYIGGIVGTNNQTLNLSYSSNLGKVTGISSQNSNYTGSSIHTFIGGIIGEVNNLNLNGNSIKYVTNKGDIEGNQIIGKTGSISRTYAGGIFGSAKGFGFKLSEMSGSTEVVRNGRFDNSGEILGGYINTSTYLYGAGIGVMNTSELYANVSYMTNGGGFTYTNFNFGTHNAHLFYAATVIDNTTSGITLSRAYNTNDFIFPTSYFSNASGFNPNEIRIAPFFNSTQFSPSRLLFVENMGNLTVGSPSNDTTVTKKLKISNISQSPKIDYTNVINSGNIQVYRLNNTSDAIYVAGITWVLPYIANYAYKMKNSFNEGKIITAGILGNTTINSYSGTSHTQTDFASNITTRNLYVAGLVNLNVGEITNSYNLGEITSKHSEGLKDIIGTGNTYVGGLVTFNYNLLQDVANSGNILYTNTSESIAHFAGTTVPTNTGSSSSTFGGIAIAYTGGLTLGGISAGIGNRNATELTGNGRFEGEQDTIFARILDTSNNGDIYGKAKSYVRSGGILGIALGVELASGTHNNTSISDNITPGPFGRSIIGVNDTIKDALLSNGLNFGNVFAVTQTIGTYLNNPGSGSTNGSDPTAQRPGINASSGGIIAYGLTRMKRMLNHGVVSSTDVAGGIIGATYILGTPTDLGTNYLVTPVEIDTAVHYGKVKAIKNANYSSFTYDAADDFNALNSTNHAKYYIDGDTTFIFPSQNNMDLSLRPSKKRGFGGIFGRMQRGNRGAMRGDNFINIMNMDPHVDLIGRADANLPGSMVFYRFFNPNRPETYYTARLNDTTSASVIGWLDIRRYGDVTHANSISFSIRRNGNGTTNNPYTYHILDNISVTNYTASVNRVNHTRHKMNYNGTSVTTTAYDIDINPFNVNYNSTRTFASGGTSTAYSSDYDISRYGITPGQVQSLFSRNNTRPYTTTNYDLITRMDASNRTNMMNLLLDSDVGNNARYEMQKISDVETPDTLYIFDEDFPLMDAENADFIYQANKDVLAAKFQDGGTNVKPDGGMYVLASTLGRENGAVLPSNIKINELYRINETQFKYINLLNTPSSDRINSGTPESSVEMMLKAYKDMFQLSYNDKSLILPQETNTSLGDIVLHDPSGMSPVLSGGIIDNDAHTITFNVSNSAFSQNNYSYKVLSANLSENAVIAKSNITVGEHTAFSSVYQSRTSNIIQAPSFEAIYSGSVTSGSQTSFTLTVYSEISAMDSGLITKYKQDYTVYINRLSTNIQHSTNIQIDDNATTTTTTGNLITVTNPSLLVESHMDVTITESTTLLPLGHEMFIHALYLNGNEVDPMFYTYQLQPKTGNNLGFTIQLSELLPAATYTIEYGFYESATKYTIAVTKAQSTLYNIEDIEYDTYSQDVQNSDFEFIPINQNFTTYIEFGLIFNEVTSINQSLVFEPVLRDESSDYPSYVDNILHYEVYLNGQLIIDKLQISSFAEITGGSISYSYLANGIKTYNLSYQIKSEAAATSTTIEHMISERPLEPMIIYKDDNLQVSDSIFVTREAFATRVDIDFNFIYDVLNADVQLAVQKNAEPFVYTSDEIYYETGFYFHLVLTSELEVGNKAYTFTLSRDGGNAIYELGTIEIEKLLGVSAYLTDIHFQIDSDLTIVYPTIRALDSNLDIIGQYDTRIYFDGIDYANADVDNQDIFRIDGKVADLVLESYSPNFKLPFGATIERFDGTNWVSDLDTDFLGDENQAAIILYKVISEDGMHEVFYYITATDIRYNLTLRFNIYYEFSDGTIIAADEALSPIKNKVVLISVINLKMHSSFDPQTAGYDEPNGVYPDVYNYIDGINSQSTLFYFTNPGTNYIYRFGRNTTGSYNFSIVSPIYTGATLNNLVTGERYDYTIYLETHSENDWHHESHELPEDDDGEYNGRFYFIRSTSPNQIVRQFAIVIKESTSNANWGLYDDYTSWDN